MKCCVVTICKPVNHAPDFSEFVEPPSSEPCLEFSFALTSAFLSNTLFSWSRSLWESVSNNSLIAFSLTTTTGSGSVFWKKFGTSDRLRSLKLPIFASPDKAWDLPFRCDRKWIFSIHLSYLNYGRFMTNFINILTHLGSLCISEWNPFHVDFGHLVQKILTQPDVEIHNVPETQLSLHNVYFE